MFINIYFKNIIIICIRHTIMYDVYNNRGIYEDNNNNIYIFLYSNAHADEFSDYNKDISGEAKASTKIYTTHGQTI